MKLYTGHKAAGQKQTDPPVMTLRPRSPNGRWVRATDEPIPQKAGKPKTPKPKKPAKVDELAQEHAAAAVKALVGVMLDDSASPTARISAAATLLQWGFGKAVGNSGGKAGAAADLDLRKGRHLIRLSWGEPAPDDRPQAID